MGLVTYLLLTGELIVYSLGNTYDQEVGIHKKDDYFGEFVTGHFVLFLDDIGLWKI